MTRCLDVSRLVTRIGRTLTGVDRVELAYLEGFLKRDEPLFGLTRTPRGYLLLDQKGLRRFAHDCRRGKASLEVLRGDACARCLPLGLGRMLRRKLSEGTHYYNTGHNNFSTRVIRAFRSLPGASLNVLVHDVIPLDYPEYQRPEAPERFRKFLQRVSNAADVVIFNSEDTAVRAKGYFTELGRTPDHVTAHLGVTLPKVDETAPIRLGVEGPYFLTVGTIEPRKNHALLLDIWAGFEGQADAPQLVIAGARGWENHNVFDRLDAKPAKVREVSGLTDAEMMGFLKGANGLLFPSFAEGFGLPPVEAAALGVPVVCSDLAVYREFLGDIPVYASPHDAYLWEKIITGLMAPKTSRKEPTPEYSPPTWEAHLNTVLKRTEYEVD